MRSLVRNNFVFEQSEAEESIMGGAMGVFGEITIQDIQVSMYV